AQARAKLRQARVSMARQNYDAAQALAHEVEMMGVSFGPREDTPQKILSDIAAIRATPGVPDDPKSLLAAARESLAKGQLDAAEQFALEAQKHSSKWDSIKWWSSDSPSKVLKEIKAARAKQPRPTPGSMAAPAPVLTTTSAKVEAPKSEPP